MLFVIFWNANPEKVPEVIRLAKSGDTRFVPPGGVKDIAEYVTPGGKFIQIVEAESAEPITKYVVAAGLKDGLCTSVEVHPVLPIDKWVECF
mgnify:CR=1 FL=1